VIRIRSRLLFVTLRACSTIGRPAEIFERRQPLVEALARAPRDAPVMRSGHIRHVSAAICARDGRVHPPTQKN
jgi:hypothetical protein